MCSPGLHIVYFLRIKSIFEFESKGSGTPPRYEFKSGFEFVRGGLNSNHGGPVRTQTRSLDRQTPPYEFKSGFEFVTGGSARTLAFEFKNRFGSKEIDYV